MAEQESELERIRAANLMKAQGHVVSTLQRQGAERVRALEVVDEHVTFLLMPGARWRAELGDLQLLGSSDEHLEYFARMLHLHHPELGGKAVPFGNDPGPTPEGITQQAARIKASQAEAEARSQATEA